MKEQYTFKDTAFLLTPKDLRLINSSYDVSAEKRLVDKWSFEGVSVEMVKNYLKNSLLSLGFEFAVGSKVQIVEYDFVDNQVFLPGTQIPARQMLEQAAIAERLQDTRSHSELWGWNKIEEGLQDGAKRIWQISPPCQENGSYGFLYDFQVMGNKLQMFARRFDYEDKKNLVKSRQMATALDLSIETERPALSLIEQPKIVDADLVSQLLPQFKELGIKDFDAFSQIAEKIILKDQKINLYILQYQNALLSGNLDSARKLLYVFFDRAKKIVLYLRKSRNINTPFFPAWAMGSGCRALYGGNEFSWPLPVYATFMDKDIGNVDRIVTCPHCGTTQLVDDRCKSGFKCVGCERRAGKCVYDGCRTAKDWEKKIYQNKKATPDENGIDTESADSETAE